ncbi:MAG: hypothetical protein VX874_03475 [Pseudomonadota bacterium]|nr:hypothetical protein [Pseudomonadota bacterium]
MPHVDAISVTRPEHIATLSARFAVREVSTEFEEPLIFLETALPVGRTLVELEEIGMEAAGRALIARGDAERPVYALFAQGMTP